MKRSRTFPIWTPVLLAAAAIFAQAAGAAPGQAPALSPSAFGGSGGRGFGDLVAGPWDVTAATSDPRCFGVEWAWGHYWVSGGGHPAGGWVYMIHKLDANGAYLASYPQVTNAAQAGGLDMEADEAANLLWAGAEGGEVSEYRYDPVSGGLTHSQLHATAVPGTVGALCRNPASGHFYTKYLGGDVYEFDLASGAVLNSFVNPAAETVGFGWDYVNGTIWVNTCCGLVREMDPGTGQFTHRGFGTPLNDLGGVDVYDDPRNPNTLSIAVLHAGGYTDQMAVYSAAGCQLMTWPANLPSAFVSAPGWSEGFESHAGVLPGHMAVTELDVATGMPDPEAWANIGQHQLPVGGGSQLPHTGSYMLELGLDPASANPHGVRCALVIGLDAGGATNLTLDFWLANLGGNYSPFDGAWVSEDGTNWVKVFFGWDGYAAQWQKLTGVELSAAVQNCGGGLLGRFYLMFSLQGNLPLGGGDGAQIDDLEIHGALPGPRLAVTNLVAGGTATATVSNATPGRGVLLGYSLAGGGPITTLYGDVLLSQPIGRLTLVADATGVAAVSRPIGTAWSGVPLWAHAFDVGTLTLTNGFSGVIQ